jgi:multidrug resistance protein, MATE family
MSAPIRPLPAGPVRPAAVLSLAWPFMVSMVGHTIASLVDTAFVSALGTAALAGTGLAITASYFVTAFSMGAVGGVRVEVAQRTGAGDDAAVGRLGWQALWLSLALGLLPLLLVPLGPALFALMGAAPDVSADAAAYFGPRVIGAPALTLVTGLSGWFQGRGDTRTPMVATLLANLINVPLDLLLIFGWGPVPAMGVAGAAWATTIGQALAALWLMQRGWSLLRGQPRGLDWPLLRRAWQLGLPMGTRFMLDVASFTLFAGILARVGAVQLAAHVVVIRIASVAFLPGHAVAEATGVLVGQSIGAGRWQGARQSFEAGTRVAVWMMLGWAVLFILVPGPFLLPFDPEPAVADLAVQLLAVAALFQVTDAVAMVAFASLTGAGDTRFAMVASVSCAWLAKLPLGWFLAERMGMGALGAWIGLTAEVWVLAGIGWWRVRGDRWLPAASLASSAPAPEPSVVEPPIVAAPAA